MRVGRNEITKEYSNIHQIMKFYFQIFFEFTCYATSAFTVSYIKFFKEDFILFYYHIALEVWYKDETFHRLLFILLLS